MSWMHVKSTELITNIISISTIVCKTTNYIYICTILSILFTLARIHILKRAINPLYNKNEELSIRII